MQVVNLIYLNKYFADIEDLREGRVIKPLKEFVVEWFLCKFGIKKYAECMLRDFSKSLSEYSKDYERFKFFGQLCGLSTPSKTVDLDKGDVKKSFMQSPGIQYAITRFIYRLRCGLSPYLPVLQVKNASTSKMLEDLGNFLNIEKSRKVFLAFVAEYGYQEDRFPDFFEMIKCIAEQEQKHIEHYTILKEGADLK